MSALTTTVRIDRDACGQTGLFGGPLTWAIEALAAAPAGHRYHFQAFSDCYSVAAGSRETSRIVPPGTLQRVAVPLVDDDIIGFLLEQSTDDDPKASTLQLHADVHRSDVPLDKELSYERAHRAFAQHFRWRPFLQAHAEAFCRDAGVDPGSTLGVHFRGTDKPGTEGTSIDQQLVIDTALECLQRREFGFSSIFIATDEQRFITAFEAEFARCHAGREAGPRLVYLMDPTRVTDDKPIPVFRRGDAIPSAECLTYAVVNMLILSNCKLVLKSPSALSCFAKIMRPELPLRLINAFTEEWVFPDAQVPLYTPADVTLRERLRAAQLR